MGSREFNIPPVDFNGGSGIPVSRRPANPQFQPNLPFIPFDVGSAAGPSSSFAPPPAYSAGAVGTGFGAFEDEPPLLEELGINTRLIWKKTLNLLNPVRVNPNLHEDGDLSGPFLFFLAFGFCQLLAGKLHFGVILGWMSVASLFIYIVFNMLAGRNGSLDLYRCFSLVGYCMLPMVMLSASALFLPPQGALVLSMAAITVIWCTRACSCLVVAVGSQGNEHRGLVAYACCLIFMLFSLLVVF